MDKIISQAQEIIQSEWAARAPGLCVAVSVNGDTVWSQAYGFADLERQIPATTTTRFRIGSVSKPLTAAALAMLVERGQLDLDAPVQKYIPDFPQKDGVITPRLLAGHLTGIRNYRGTEAVSNLPYPNLRSGLKIFENDPLESPPGTKFSYASYNWNVLGVVMESAAGRDFLACMNETVIRPLGLDDTIADRAGVEDAQRTQFYEADPAGKFLVAPKVDLSFVWPAGGYLSTAEDLVRFGAAHFRPGFLKPESLKLLFTPQKTLAGASTPYGIGWFVVRDVWHHGGDSIGGMATLLMLPSARVVVAIVGNSGQGLLQNAIRKGRAPEEARQFLVKKDVVAHKIARLFAPQSAARDK